MKKQSSLFDFLSKAPAKRKAEDNEDANDSPKKAKKIEKKVFDVEEIEDISDSDTESMDMSRVDTSIRCVPKKNQTGSLRNSNSNKNNVNSNKNQSLSSSRDSDQFKSLQKSSNNNNNNQSKSSLRNSKDDDNFSPNNSNQTKSNSKNTTNQTIQWSWAEDDGTWVNYSEFVNLKIESAYQNQEPSVGVDKLRSVEFYDMIQRRNDDFLKTRARQVRRCINGVDSTAKPAWISRTGSGRVVVEKEIDDTNPGQWYWKNDNSKWIPMDSAINGIIEDAYLRKEEKVKIDSERGVNLKTMFQYRIDNPSRVRPIKREVEIQQTTNDGKSKKTVSPSSTFSIVAEWCWLNENTGEWTNYDSEISKKLEDNYVRKTADKVSVDNTHYVDLVRMIQCRTDKKSNNIHVKRKIPEQQMKNVNEMTQLIEPKLTNQQKEIMKKNKEEAKKKLESKKGSSNSLSPKLLQSKPKTPMKKIFQEDSDEDSDNEATLVMGDDFLKQLKSSKGLSDNSNKKKNKEENEDIEEDTIDMQNDDDDDDDVEKQKNSKEEEEENMQSDAQSDSETISLGDEKNEKAVFYTEEELLKNKRTQYKCGTDFSTLADIDTWTESLENISVGELNESAFSRRKEINDKVSLWVGDMTKIEIDCIVNAAKPSLLGGGGIDGAIHRAAGPSLLQECAMIGGCDPGQSRITSGYRLPASYVIHTVGPVSRKPKVLESCYKSVLKKFLSRNLRTLVFCCISTGIYGYPNDEAADIALNITRKWLEEDDNYKKVDRIIFCIFDVEADLRIYKKLMAKKYFPPPL